MNGSNENDVGRWHEEGNAPLPATTVTRHKPLHHDQNPWRNYWESLFTKQTW